MRRLKWIPLAFALGLLIVLNPTHSPAQFERGKGGGKGGFGGGGFGGAQPGAGGFGGAQPGAGGFGGAQPGAGGFGGQLGGFGGGGGKGGFGGGKGGFGGGGGKGGFGGGQPGGFGGGGMQPFGAGAQPVGGAPGAVQPLGGAPGGFGGGGGRGNGFGGGGNGFGGGGTGFGGGGNGFGGGGAGGMPGGGMPPGGGGGGRGGMRMDPEQTWAMLGGSGDTLDLSKVSPQLRMISKGLSDRYGVEPLPETGVMTKAAFLEFSARNQAKISAAMSTGGTPGGGGMALTMGGDPNNRQMRFNFDPNGGGGGFGGYGGGFGGFGGGNGEFGGNRQERKEPEEPKPVAVRYGHLPEGLPDWFDSNDLDKDGQVAMHEWRKAGGDLAEFQSYDLNNDGLVTSDELIRGGVASRTGGGRRGGGRGGSPGESAGFTLPGATPPPSSEKVSPTNDKTERPSKGQDRPSGDQGGSSAPNPFRKGDFGGGKKGRN